MFDTPIAFQGTHLSKTTRVAGPRPAPSHFKQHNRNNVNNLFNKSTGFVQYNKCKQVDKLFSREQEKNSSIDPGRINSEKFIKGVFPLLFVAEQNAEAVLNSNLYDESNDELIQKTTNQTHPCNTDKFTFAQKIESTKAAMVGLFTGGIVVAPFNFLHDVVLKGATISNGFAQFEYDTDMGSIMAALFAIVYRYCVRKGEEKNEMLPMGVIGAFALVRTLSRVRVSTTCTPVPLQCGAPIGYFDWDMMGQAVFSGIESLALFGSVAYAMEYCYTKEWISRLDN
jgi:hypothetical protein